MARAFDVVVVGGGHAGAEAAWAAARVGARTALITHDPAAIGRLSCNPAIGGIGKGQIVREVDALGGLMGLIADEAGIQFRMLNRRKGPAVQSPRAQADSHGYPLALQARLATCPNLVILAAGVEALQSESCGHENRRITGVELSNGEHLTTLAVVIASGTFLRGLMHTGEDRTVGGRIDEAAANGLSTALAGLGLRLGRLKTGTPPRVARESVDFSRLVEQPGDAEPVPFSFLTERITQTQIVCWHTSTNPAVHALIRANLARAPLYSGQIESTGPRYCPSIETKVLRFPEKDRHQIFLEPEGRHSARIYINGISTSLPRDIQAQMVALIPGLERARIVQWGYAVEYDFVPPEQIDATLMTKTVRGLFLAGQINGTSGYEEAAGQGLLAGLNAARFVAGQAPVVLGRDQAYLGVLVDDLVTRGLIEPYRMFTSRAEHRMHLRTDNADERLTPIGRETGLVDDQRWLRFERRRTRIAELLALVGILRFDGRSVAEWLCRPEEDGERFRTALPELRSLAADADVWSRVLVELKYEGYIRRQAQVIAQSRAMEERLLPPDLDYHSIAQLRFEARERWEAVRPRSIGQAARVSGIRPTDVSLLLVHMAALERRRTAG